MSDIKALENAIDLLKLKMNCVEKEYASQKEHERFNLGRLTAVKECICVLYEMLHEMDKAKQ